MRSEHDSSVIKKTILFIVIQFILIATVFGVYVVNSYSNIKNAQSTSTENTVEIFGRELDNKIKNADMLLEQMIYQNDNYDMLQSNKESDRYYASMALKTQMVDFVTYNQYVDAFVIAESLYNTFIDYSNTFLTFDQRNALRDFTMDKASQGRMKATWQIENIGSEPYLYKIYVWQGEAAAVFISAKSFLGNANTEDISNTTIVLYDEVTGKIWGQYGEELSEAATGNSLNDIETFAPIGDKYVLKAEGFSIKAFVSNEFNFRLLKYDVWVTLAMILILSFFTLFMIGYLRKSIIKPISKLQKNMERIQLGDYELRIGDELGSRELNLLRDTFNKLMDEILGLKIQTYEKQILLQETELKSVKLQIRPHFFLNAMTTISSLSWQGKNEEIRQYIEALSKNIRYMFRSGLHTVPLEEEIRHVENYFEMQELKYPGCVFYFMEVPDEAKEWMIPQMLIHTVIENEYKYAVAMDSMLTILIKAEKVMYDGEEMLRIEIEDDGRGYPEETIKDFAIQNSYNAKDGSRVGLWSIKRILEIMYEREGLFSISNIEPHGCKNTMYIPRKPKHEVDEAGKHE